MSESNNRGKRYVGEARWNALELRGDRNVYVFIHTRGGGSASNGSRCQRPSLIVSTVYLNLLWSDPDSAERKRPEDSVISITWMHLLIRIAISENKRQFGESEKATSHSLV